MIIILNITDMQMVKQTDIWNHTLASLFEWWLNFEKLSTLLKLFSSLDSKCTCIPTFALYIHLSICPCMYTSYISIFLSQVHIWLDFRCCVHTVYIYYIPLECSIYLCLHLNLLWCKCTSVSKNENKMY